MTWIYNYDRGGNITSKVKYAYTTGAVGTAAETIPYVYGDSSWKDKLTSYNGQTITCDAIGNPTNDGIWSYTWEAGRQLKQMSTEGTSVSFKYDHNGMRVQKVVEQSWYPETTNYIYHGKLLTYMTVDYTDFDEVAHQDKLHFFYDEQNRPAKIEFNGTVYTYLHNLQGDIVGIVDNTGALVVEYKYDAWGRPLNTAGTLADTLGKRNPFRYRGYVFDEETELYYLRNRYYSPSKGRFVNADTRFSNGSLFAYCDGNPSALYDPNGDLPRWLEKPLCAFGSGVMVFAGGAINTVGSLFGAQAAGGALMGAGMELFDQTVLQDRSFNEIQWEKVIIEGAVGFTTGMIPGSGAVMIGKRIIVASFTEACLSAGAYNYGPREFGWTFIRSTITNAISEGIGTLIDKFVTTYITSPNTYTTDGYRAKMSRAGISYNHRQGAYFAARHNELVRIVSNAVATILE